MAILGYQQLYRWLTLLLATAGNDSTPPALMKTAITRGRLTELLGQDYLEKSDRDNLFIVGIFSLLDAMLEMPMADILEKLYLPDSHLRCAAHAAGHVRPLPRPERSLRKLRSQAH